MVGKTAPILQADEERFQAIAEIGCLPCLIDGIAGTPADVHHPTAGFKRISTAQASEHQHTYGACPWHHRGQSRGAMKPCGLPSLALNKRAYRERYGTELELVQLQDALIRCWERGRREGWYLSPQRLVRLARSLHRQIMVGHDPDLDEDSDRVSRETPVGQAE